MTMKHLNSKQRYAIKAYRESGKTMKFIALQLGVSESTISRELKRNATKSGRYNPDFAQELANERKERFASKRKFDEGMKKLVESKLVDQQWSPEQIKGHCDKHGTAMVSVERIYQHIRADKEKGGELYKRLRHRLKHRKRPVGGSHQVIKDKVSIEQRPGVVDNKERFGDWEVDLIVGKDGKGAILTIVERLTGMVFILGLPHGKNAKMLAKALIRLLMPYKKFIKSITSDNGSEFAQHKLIAKKLQADFYFAHPYSSWERGLSEYTNKLARQYIPKKSDFATFDQQYLIQVQYKLNSRPRKNLNFEKPKDVFYKLAS